MLGSVRKGLVVVAVAAAAAVGFGVRESSDHSAAVAASATGEGPCDAQAVVVEAVRVRRSATFSQPVGSTSCRAQWAAWAAALPDDDASEPGGYDVVVRSLTTSGGGSSVRVDGALEESWDLPDTTERGGGEVPIRARLHTTPAGVVLDRLDTQYFNNQWVPFT